MSRPALEWEMELVFPMRAPTVKSNTGNYLDIDAVLNTIFSKMLFYFRFSEQVMLFSNLIAVESTQQKQSPDRER